VTGWGVVALGYAVAGLVWLTLVLRARGGTRGARHR
jgi:hypothetical protein